MSVDLESARLELEDAYRELTDVGRDDGGADALWLQVDAVTRELRRRVGGVFTLRQLADEYARADVVLLDRGREGACRMAAAPLARRGGRVDLYARGALDYAP